MLVRFVINPILYMAIIYDTDDYADNKRTIIAHFADYHKLLTESPELKELSFDAYLNFVVSKAQREGANDLLFDIFHHVRQELQLLNSNQRTAHDDLKKLIDDLSEGRLTI